MVNNLIKSLFLLIVFCSLFICICENTCIYYLQLLSCVFILLCNAINCKLYKLLLITLVLFYDYYLPLHI